MHSYFNFDDPTPKKNIVLIFNKFFKNIPLILGEFFGFEDILL